MSSSLLSPTDSTWTPLDSSGLRWSPGGVQVESEWSLLNCYFRDQGQGQGNWNVYAKKGNFHFRLQVEYLSSGLQVELKCYLMDSGGVYWSLQSQGLGLAHSVTTVQWMTQSTEHIHCSAETEPPNTAATGVNGYNYNCSVQNESSAFSSHHIHSYSRLLPVHRQFIGNEDIRQCISNKRPRRLHHIHFISLSAAGGRAVHRQ